MLTQVLSPTPAPAESGARPLAVTIYTRADCGCCRRALDLLEAFARDGRVTLEVADADASPERAERFGESVPVVEVEGKVRFRGVINPVLFERLLRAQRPAEARPL